MPKVDILGVHVDAIDKAGLEDAITNYVRGEAKAVIAYANIHAINLARKDMEFRKFLNGSSLLYCDGEGVRVGARILGSTLPPRVALTRWIWNLCALCVEQRFSVFFLGSTGEVLDKAVAKLKRRFPALLIAGSHHGYFQKVGPESDAVIEVINRLRPNLLFVGFGMPAQEHWISRNLERLDVNVVLPAGSMIDYVSGAKGVAPAWMSDIGLEWLYRLIQEPQRLWKRYLIGNPGFVLQVLAQRLKRGRQA